MDIFGDEWVSIARTLVERALPAGSELLPLDKSLLEVGLLEDDLLDGDMLWVLLTNRLAATYVVHEKDGAQRLIRPNNDLRQLLAARATLEHGPVSLSELAAETSKSVGELRQTAKHMVCGYGEPSFHKGASVDRDTVVATASNFASFVVGGDHEYPAVALDGIYQREEQSLGAGGVGSVIRHRLVRSTIWGQSSKEVAVKLVTASALKRANGKSDAGEHRLKQEFRVGRLHRSPRLVKTFDLLRARLRSAIALGGYEDVYALVMEQVDGSDLKRAAAGDVLRARRLALGLSLAVHDLHAEHVVHRDVKPDNALVKDDETVVLLDYGLAKVVANPGVTEPDDHLATRHYAPPEQLTEPQDEMYESDVYALAASTYELFTGRRPFDGVRKHELLGEKKRSPLELPCTIAVEQRVRDAVRLGTMPNPADRITLADFIAALQ